jgi:DNA-directed RNA polymerase subunit RPC12/RpoP
MRKIAVEVVYVECPRCGKKIFGLNEPEAKRMLIEHLNSGCWK